MTTLLDAIKSKSWRMNNLYHIIDKEGSSIRFRLNGVQSRVLEKLHTRNLILKARQLGMSTFSVLHLLDECLHHFNFSAGIVSYSLEHAQYIFKKIIGHALERFPFKNDLKIERQSAREISFGNGSTLRVDTTLRGGAYQLVLVSEFGKTCARSPVKAEEIVTGTLNTLSASGTAIIESTGEGQEGYFADMCMSAKSRGDTPITDLDYKLFFFPWFEEPSYALQTRSYWSTELEDYFKVLSKETGVIFTIGQKNWYGAQYGLLGDKMKQEFPSTIQEAFSSSSDAYYFSQAIDKAYAENRCLSVSPYDALAPVYAAMDIGVNDLTVIILFQVVHGEIRIIDFVADSNKGVDYYSHHLLQDRSYLYHSIYLPHDSVKRDSIDPSNSVEKQFRKAFSHTQTKFIVLPQVDKQLSIANTKLKLDRCIFNMNKCKPLVDHLVKYRKKWSEQYGRYLDDPFHDEHSNYADAMRYTSQACDQIERQGNIKGSFEKHKQAVDSRYRRVI